MGLGGWETGIEERWTAVVEDGHVGRLSDEDEDEDFGNETNRNRSKEDVSFIPQGSARARSMGLQLDLGEDENTNEASAEPESYQRPTPSLPVYHDPHELQTDSTPTSSPMVSRTHSRAHSLSTFGRGTPTSSLTPNTETSSLPATEEDFVQIPTKEGAPVELDSFLKTQDRFRLFSFVERLLEWPWTSSTSSSTPRSPPPPPPPTRANSHSIASTLLSLPLSRTASNSSLYELIGRPSSDPDDSVHREVGLGVDTHEHISSELGESYVRDCRKEEDEM